MLLDSPVPIITSATKATAMAMAMNASVSALTDTPGSGDTAKAATPRKCSATMVAASIAVAACRSMPSVRRRARCTASVDPPAAARSDRTT
jgi:hypothetical protein